MQRNITYNHLANLSGVTPSTVYSLLDSRRREVSLRTLKIICDGLDIELCAFFDSAEFHDLGLEIENSSEKITNDSEK